MPCTLVEEVCFEGRKFSTVTKLESVNFTIVEGTLNDQGYEMSPYVF